MGRSRNFQRDDNFMLSIRESRFVADSFVEGDSEYEHEDGSPNSEADNTNNDDGSTVKKVAAKEHKRVRIWRYVVILMLLVAGGTTSSLTYGLLKSERYDDFVTTYNLFTDTIKDATDAHLKDIQVSFEGLADIITGYAGKVGATFPFVTLPLFEVQAEHTRQASHAEVLTYAPFVAEEERKEWEAFAWKNQQWIKNSRDISLMGQGNLEWSQYLDAPISDIIYEHEKPEPPFVQIPAVHSPFLPAWHTSPPPFFPGFVNFNFMSEYLVKYTFPIIQSLRLPVMSMVVDLSRLGSTAVNEYEHNNYHSQFAKNNNEINDNNDIDSTISKNSNYNGYDHPHSMIMVPVFEKLNDRESPIVGLLFGVIAWDKYFVDLLPEDVSGIHAVLRNTCGQSFTYKMVGSKVIYLGEGDFHERHWNDMKKRIDLYDRETPNVDGNCLYSLDLYPSHELYSKWETRLPTVFACVVAGTFVIMAITFFMYDRNVRRRNKKVTKEAAKTDKIVASLFPSNIRDRLLAEEEDFEKRQTERGARTRLKDFLANDGPSVMDMEKTNDFMFKTRPIADLFPDTTIMFADISGFTAWSSTREPSQVFMLLETVYKAFDEIAKRRRVFKVETVGDCYVAAAGLPDRRKDHAVAVARFGRECMTKMNSLTRKLEVSLGPDTADLSLRMGIHSGPVTAGVLRGERSRFQLFGDTMNTASRMESTGLPRRIHISKETADLLYESGKGRWIVRRQDTVVAKGKGELETYWLVYHGDANNENTSSKMDTSEDSGDVLSTGDDDESYMEAIEEEEEEDDDLEVSPEVREENAKNSRLINWNKEVLVRLLKAIVARRRALNHAKPTIELSESFIRDDGVTVLDEVEEVVALPAFDPSVVRKEVKVDSIKLDEVVEEEVAKYVASIAAMYRDNPFHNFEHASHVALSVSKLLSRIVAPSDLDFANNATRSQILHDHTYGITSDPLTPFACVLSALVHDVDHTGVPNTQLCAENETLALYYKGRSVAEQNSVDVAWELLMDPSFSNLRATIYQTEEEMKRFRQLVVNSVMATDIMDKELKQLRNARWEKAFSEASHAESSAVTVHRKATIVIEHLIQASDVSHTMQHWHVYRKWNQRLFEEMYVAYKKGRAEKDPSTFWYEGEIGFFDFYIIPLARKLKDCGVFGVSSDEYLNYALQNREEWAARGQQVVAELIEGVKTKFP